MNKRILFPMLAVVLALALPMTMPVAANGTVTVNYGDVNLEGGFEAGHFDDIWDLTAGDIVLEFTYNATGLVDDFGGGAHAWAELGVRSVTWASETVDLIAGQHIDVGDVVVQRVGDELCVEYQLSAEALAEGWFLTETHLAIATDPSDIPQTKKGNAIPGQFLYGDDDLGVCDGDGNLIGGADSYSECVSLSDLGIGPEDEIYVAAHAVVCKLSEVVTETVVSDAGSDDVLVITEDTSNPGYPIDYPGPYEGTSAPAVSTWVHPLWPTIAGAHWISSAYYVEDQVNNSWRLFTRSFDIPANAVNLGGTLRITSDNAEEVYLNDSSVGVDGEVYGPFIDDREWDTVITYGVSPQPGENVLEVMVRNYAQSGGTVTSNPTGLIYSMDYHYQLLECETAWGAGIDFPGKNWATYFTYSQAVVPNDFNPTWDVEGSGVWLATDYEWTANTFDPDPPGAPAQDLDDKLILQKAGGHGEGDYNLPSTPPNPWANHAVWFDRDGVNQWQALMWGAIDGVTYNTSGTYDVVITLHATGDTTGTAYMTVNGEPQGFYVPGWHSGPADLMPAGMTFTGDMEHLQVFYGLYGYGATHTVRFTNITVTQ